MKLLPLLAFLLSVSVHGQPSTIKFRTLCFEHVDEIKEVVIRTGGSVSDPVPLYTSMFSKEIQTTPENGIITFILPPSAGTAPEQQPVIASAKALPSPQQLLLFVPQPKSPGVPPYRLLVFDDSEASLPMGSTRLLNFANTPARFVIGEHSMELNPGGITTISQALKRNATNQTPVEVSFANAQGGWTPVSSTRWLSLPNQRAIAISFVHPVSRQPLIRWYQDVPPWRLPKL